MIRVTVELLTSSGYKQKKLGTLEISNRGIYGVNLADYHVVDLETNQEAVVKSFDRELGFWKLIERALQELK